MPVIKPLAGESAEAPKQHNQPSRKGKKAWRKNVDVSEVNKGLEVLNDEIIRGGVIKEKASSELFTVDLGGDSRISKKFPKHIKKGLRADEIISQRSAVPAVSLRKRPGETSGDILPAKRHRADWVTHKDLARLKRVADGHHGATVEIKDASYDLWDVAVQPKQADVDDFVDDLPPAKAPKSLKQQPISLLASGKLIPAVPKPSGGHSYNPMFADYEERLADESKKALDAEQLRVDTLAAEQRKKDGAARSAAEAEAAEARANLSEWEEDSEWEGFQSGGDEAKLSSKRPERKTQAQRNRIKRRKEDEQLARHKASTKTQRTQEQRIKEIAAEVAERESSRLALAAHESDSGSDFDDEKLRRRQIGKYKLPQKDLELVLPDELQESLRLLKPEGNLMRDRYRNMLLRGKVESRRHIPFKRQAKTKTTEKWTHKDFVL